MTSVIKDKLIIALIGIALLAAMAVVYFVFKGAIWSWLSYALRFF